MLQIEPEYEIVLEFVYNNDFKYLRALGAFYLRLIGTPKEIYKHLEPLYVDFRKLRIKEKDGKYSLIYLDVFIEKLLTEESFLDITLPFLPKRWILEESNLIEPRKPLLTDLDLEDFDDIEEEEEKEEKSQKLKFKEKIDEKVDSIPEKETYLDIRNKKKIQEERYNEEDKNDEILKQNLLKSKKIENQNNKESLSIDDSNDMRKKLGLKPLKE
jgi:pre-mRNA-splicing factor 38A